MPWTRAERRRRPQLEPVGSPRIPVAENPHVDGILDLTVVPAHACPPTSPIGRRLRAGIADALDYVGVLAVELFVVGGELLVNEIAPRPHNSGHWTLDVAQDRQFEQQIRAVCGLALGDTSMIAAGGGDGEPARRPVVDGDPRLVERPRQAARRLHLYGKVGRQTRAQDGI